MPKPNKSKSKEDEIPKPKRFLTAYNFFFMHERAVFLAAQVENDGPPSSSSEQPNTSLVTIDSTEKPWTKKTKKTHKKTHGKISFKDLTSRVSSKWKAMSPEERKKFDDMAREDLARFQKENKEYKEKLLLASKKEDKDKQKSEVKVSVANGTTTQPNLESAGGIVQETRNTQLSSLLSGRDFGNDHIASTSPSMSLLGMDEKTRSSCRIELNNGEPKAPIIEMPLASATQTFSLQKNTSAPSADPIEKNNCFPEIAKSMKDHSKDGLDDIESISMDFGSIDSFTVGTFALMSIATENNHEKQSCSIVYESLTTRVFRVSDPSSSIGTSTTYFAIKTFSDQYPNSKQISCLENEYNISCHLSGCRFTRNAIKLNKNEEQYALFLEWAAGITLKEWIKSTHASGSTFEIGKALLLAWEISKALSEIHNMGVTHNKLSPENIIIDVNKQTGTFSVNIIDFGSASIRTDDGCDPDMTQRDLQTLGVIYVELFSGVDPYSKNQTGSSDASIITQEKDSVDSGEKFSGNRELSQLRCDLQSVFRSKVPLSIASLVLSMIFKRGESYHYKSASAVEKDLHAILTDTKSFLTDDMTPGQLFLITNFYGRDHHLTLLRDAYIRVRRPETSSEMILVAGYSGTGKSTLVQQFRKSLSSERVFFLCGKFDQLQQIKPLSAIISAFTDLCKELAAGNQEDLHQLRTLVNETIGSDIAVLANLIPGFDQIFEVSQSGANNFGYFDALNRVKYLFRLFVQAVAIISQPLVLFLDDLQWVDAVSLDLLTSLVTDAKNNSLLLIGAYRDNEVSHNHPFTVQLCKIERQVSVQKIRVGDVGKENINQLISDTLHRPLPETQPLTNVVYLKTSGNILFVIEFLRSLCDEGLIYFSLDTKQWEWETNPIELKNIPDDAVELLTQKIITFPKAAQTSLKLIACLGSLCEEIKLCLIAEKDGNSNSTGCNGIYDDLIAWLDFAVNEGLLHYTCSVYKFAHDQIQLAAYSLIPQNERGLWHLQIGNQIWANKDIAPEKALITAVCQLNKGSSFIDDRCQKMELALLNLQAGEKAMSSAVYPLAEAFFKTGVNTLDDTSWEENHELSLKLHKSCAWANYINGHFGEMEKVLHQVFMHGKCFEDKRPAYFTQIHALGAQNKLEEAVKVGLFVLEQLGESFPTVLNDDVVAADFMKTKQMLESKSSDELLNLPVMVDSQKTSAMEILGVLSLYAFFIRKLNWSLLSFRMVQLTLLFGEHDKSASGLVNFGTVCLSFFGDIKLAYYFGQTALCLAERSKAKECLVRTKFVFYSTIHSLAEPLQASLEPLKKFYTVGMGCGEIEYAAMCAQQYCIHAFQCGTKLDTVEKHMRDYGDQLKGYRQELMYQRTLPFRQAVLNLMGRSQNPVVLTGEAMDQEQLLKNALENKNIHMAFVINHNSAWLAYIFGDYEQASKIFETKSRFGPKRTGFATYNHVFIEGLVSYVLARKTGRSEWKLQATESTKKMEFWAECTPSNFHHKFLLMQAESFFLQGKIEKAAQEYDCAIETAGRNGFIHEQAIAYERAGIFHFEQGDTSKACYYYGQAHSKYLEWGAVGKANHLCQYYPL